jgi:hypothetical protein
MSPHAAIRVMAAARLITGGTFLNGGIAAAALQSGTFLTAPGATAVEFGDRVQGETRTVPVTAALTFNLESIPPSLTAVLTNAVLEGGAPFVLTVRSDHAWQLSDGTWRFQGDYLKDIQPSGSQYLFDWRFSTAPDGRLVWNGTSGWAGGHIWMITLDDLTLTPDTLGPQLQLAGNGPQLTLTWPALYQGWRLEQSAGLHADGWSPVEQSVTLTGESYAVTVPGTASRAFFRLRKP